MFWKRKFQSLPKIIFLTAIGLFLLHGIIGLIGIIKEIFITDNEYNNVNPYVIFNEYAEKYPLFDFNFLCTDMKILNGSAPICINKNPKNVESQTLLSGFRYDDSYIQQIEYRMQFYKDMNFIDIDPGIGVYSISMLNHGYKVVAIEQKPSNLFRIWRSAKLNNRSDDLILLMNKIGHKRGYLDILDHDDENSDVPLLINNTKTVDVIYLDDIINVINFDIAFLRIILTESNMNAFSHAFFFFETMTVPYIIMNIDGVRKINKFKRTVHYLTAKKYVPRGHLEDFNTLNLDNIESWPETMFWVKKDVDNAFRNFPKGRTDYAFINSELEKIKQGQNGF